MPRSGPRVPSRAVPVRLSPEAQAKVEKMLRCFGERPTARRLQCHEVTLCKISGGGTASAATIERLERVLV